MVDTLPGPTFTRSKNGPHCCNQSCGFRTGRCKHLRYCESTAEERGAGNPHATFCGNRGRVTAPGDPVGAQKWASLPRKVNKQINEISQRLCAFSSIASN